MRKVLALAALAAALISCPAGAQEINVKIGVLTDMASLYADDTGIGSVIAARLAAEDFMKDHPNVKVTVINGDHQNKPDVGTQIANQWIDVDHVDMIADVPN
jgi:branched-chain amino acid transport system substrate-binding protein